MRKSNSQSIKCYRMKLKKNQLKKEKKLNNQVNLLNRWPRSWDSDNSIKKNHKILFSKIKMLKDKIELKNIYIKKKVFLE
jgi:hypothetical protein